MPSRIVRCECGHAFLNPQPTLAELIPLYDADYRGFTGAPIGEEFEAWFARAYQGDRLDGVLITPGGRFLDVGCGGGFLVAGMGRVGMDAEGIDPSEFTTSRAREMGLNVRCGLLHEANYPAGRFDAISMYHVLEHTDAPVEVLRECRRILKPSGELVVAVPNFDSLVFSIVKSTWVGLQLPTHLQHFSPASLRTVVESAGFVVETITTDSTRESVASELANWLRHRFLLPRRLTMGSKPLERWASRIVERTQGSDRGEVIYTRLIAP